MFVCFFVCVLFTLPQSPGLRRSSSRHSTAPSRRDARRKASGSERLFFGDSRTPRVMSHVTVCSAAFMISSQVVSSALGSVQTRDPLSETLNRTGQLLRLGRRKRGGTETGGPPLGQRMSASPWFEHSCSFGVKTEVERTLLP